MKATWASIFKVDGLNILITGASGFLGSALALRFAEMNHQVSLLARNKTNFYRLPDDSLFRIGRYTTDVEISKFIVDVCPDVVIHTACSYGRRSESLGQLIDANIRFGAVILNALKEVDKPVYFINAGTVLSRDVSLYALTKIQFEELGARFVSGQYQNIRFINIKLQHMYGPGDDISKFTSYVINACTNNVPKLPLTLGEQKRDFIYIDDVVNAYVKILENLTNLGEQQHIELGSGTPICIKDFVKAVHRLTQSKTELLFGQVPYRENDEMCMVANTEFLKSLGWVSMFDIEAGIKKTLGMGLI